MELVNLEITKEEMTAKQEAPLPAEMESKYPPGTQLYIDPDTYEKLGLEDCEAGEEVEVVGVASVRSVSMHEEGGEQRYSVNLQMTDMAIHKPSGKDAEGMYPTMKES